MGLTKKKLSCSEGRHQPSTMPWVFKRLRIGPVYLWRMRAFQFRFGQKHLPTTSTLVCPPLFCVCPSRLVALVVCGVYRNHLPAQGWFSPWASRKIWKILLTKSALWWIRYHDHESLRYAVGSWVRLAAEDGPTVNESINEDFGEYLARLLWEWNKRHQESGMCLEWLWQAMTPTLSQLLELGFPVSIRVLCRQEQSDWTHRVPPKSVSSAVRLIASPPSICTSMEHRASSSRQQRPNVCRVKDFFVRKSSPTHSFLCPCTILEVLPQQFEARTLERTGLCFIIAVCSIIWGKVLTLAMAQFPHQ